MKLLVSAFATCPGWGSEPSVGWNVVSELSKRHEVWVLTEKVWKERIEARVDLSQYPNLHLVYVDISWMHELAEHRFNRGITWLVYYYLWQFKALKVAKSLHAQHHFDLAHHVTFVKASVPSLLYQLPIPFVFGPVGGAEFAPALEFYDRFGWKQKGVEMLRLAQVQLAKLDPFLRACAQRSACAIGVTQSSETYLQQLGASHTRTTPAISLLPSEYPERMPQKAASTGPLKLVFVGRLIAWKGVDLALESLAYLLKNRPQTELHFDLIGDGPKLPALKELAQSLGLNSCVTFHGSKPREEVLERLSHADLLFFPSLHDSGGFVVIEAMVRGCPVLCLDLGGPGELVDHHSGWKVQATSRHETIHALSDVLGQLCERPQDITAKGQAARARVLEHYTSVAQAKKLEALFSELLQARSL